jgi:hypothetical protein
VVNDPTCDGSGDAACETSSSADASAADPASGPPASDGVPADGAATTIAAPGSTTATTAAPTTTEALPVIENLALGDSVMLGAAGQLAELGFVVDARESRQFTDGVDTIAALRAADRLGQRVVVHLGTNGPFDADDMRAMMAELSGVPQVVLLTNDVDRDYTADNNALVYEAVSEHPNVSLLDWDGLAPGCPGNCFYDDGLHLRPDGQRYYAALVGNVTGLG